MTIDVEKLDPVTTAVIRSGLISAVAEMKAVVLRTAYSNVWKEAGDMSCGLLDTKADLVVQGIGDIPVHMATMPYSLRGCLARIPISELRPGDVLFQNDPYQGNNHLPDLLMAKPIFVDGEVVAFSAVRGHYVDIGGSAPGSYATSMTDIYGEGLRIPPVKIYERGVLNQDIADIVRYNTRNSRERMGDLRSQYAGCNTAERRVLEFCQKYSVAAVKEVLSEILRTSEKLTRAAISTIPDGEYTFEDWCDGDAIDYEPIRIAVTVRVTGSDVHVDFTGSSPQVRGGMNAPYAVTMSATCYAVKCLTDPENPANSGSYRPISVTAPEGTIVNAQAPAPVVASNHETASRIADAVIGALSLAVPDRVCAAGSGTSGVLAIGVRASSARLTDVRQKVHIESHGAGQGAHERGDGLNARRVNVGNTGNTPNEVWEASFPVTVLKYSITTDGGGAGRHRGGTGIYREVQLDSDAIVTLVAERARFGPYGLFGGRPAPQAQFWAVLPDGTRQDLNSKTPGLFFPRGTVLHFRCAGGGGFGPPTERDVADLQADLDDGYVSPERAESDYGAVLTSVPSRPEGVWRVIEIRQEPAADMKRRASLRKRSPRRSGRSDSSERK